MVPPPLAAGAGPFPCSRVRVLVPLVVLSLCPAAPVLLPLVASCLWLQPMLAPPESAGLTCLPPVLPALVPLAPPLLQPALPLAGLVVQSPWLWVPAQLVQVAHSLCLLEPAPLLLEAL